MKPAACAHSNRVARVSGVAVFLASSLEHMPPSLMRLAERSRSLQTTVVVLTVVHSDTEAVVPARGTGRTGLDAGHRALIARPMARRPRRAALPYRRPGAWCDCSPVLVGPVPSPFPGQLACGRSASGLAPYTAHLPDPRAFAT